MSDGRAWLCSPTDCVHSASRGSNPRLGACLPISPRGAAMFAISTVASSSRRTNGSPRSPAGHWRQNVRRVGRGLATPAKKGLSAMARRERTRVSPTIPILAGALSSGASTLFVILPASSMCSTVPWGVRSTVPESLTPRNSPLVAAAQRRVPLTASIETVRFSATLCRTRPDQVIITLSKSGSRSGRAEVFAGPDDSRVICHGDGESASVILQMVSMPSFVGSGNSDPLFPEILIKSAA
jgi:hypothetical protein